MHQKNYLSFLNIIVFCNLLLFSFLPINISAQIINQIEVDTEKGSSFIPAYQREGMVYFSVKHFADVLSINYYYNAETGKIELKFDEHSIIFTEKNPFIKLAEKNEEEKLIQLPTSVYLINNILFIPADYSVSLLQKAYGGGIKFETSGNQYRLAVKEKTEEKTPRPTVIGIPTEKRNAPDYSADGGITGISLEEKVNGTLVRVNSEKKIKSYNSSYMNGVLTIIFRNVTADLEKIKNASPAGLITKIKSRNINGDTEFQFKLEKDYASNEVINAGSGNDLLITIYSSAFSKKESYNDKFDGRSKWDFNVVVIDPGHGGKDYGAIGVNGVKEKDVNLGIALKLG
ncbi:MAG TPA: N-acetylmuramoyl-L-alanine amidase, partial [Ignavibacteriaceae bacterium]|nr:N-acetylmuramoyl-L-alanine amidase [Ignavibacteriaceae bacterium]